jgi:hypothetical protein
MAEFRCERCGLSKILIVQHSLMDISCCLICEPPSKGYVEIKPSDCPLCLSGTVAHAN